LTLLVAVLDGKFWALNDKEFALEYEIVTDDVEYLVVAKWLREMHAC